MSNVRSSYHRMGYYCSSSMIKIPTMKNTQHILKILRGSLRLYHIAIKYVVASHAIPSVTSCNFFLIGQPQNINIIDICVMWFLWWKFKHWSRRISIYNSMYRVFIYYTALNFYYFMSLSPFLFNEIYYFVCNNTLHCPIY